MRHLVFTLRLLAVAYTGYLFYFLTVEYHPADPLGFQPPFVLWVIDTINLFIHEAGHFFFRLFGQTLYFLGGSLTQCLVPLALAAVTWREKPREAGYPLFWFGENLVNVSVYIADAPYQNLKLIKEGLIHDWRWLLAEHLDWAEPMGSVVRASGIIVCTAALGFLSASAVKSFRET